MVKLSKAAREFFKQHGVKGGKLGAAARMKKLTPEQRRQIAKNAAAKRWGKKPNSKTHGQGPVQKEAE